MVLLLGLISWAAAAFAADGGVPDAAAPTSLSFDEARALAYERPKCEAGDLDACLWGAMRRQPEGDRLKLLERACQLGTRGCVDLAYRLAGGPPPVPVDLPRALAITERICAAATDISEGAACLILGQITPDTARVPALFERACSLGWAGYRGHIATNYALPGGSRYYQNCLDHERLGKLAKAKRRSRPASERREK